MEDPFILIETRGPAWDVTRIMDDQVDWSAHAAFVDALVHDGVILLGGPLEGTRDVLLVMRAKNASEVTQRLASDPWMRSGLLRIKECRPWSVRLGSLPDGSPQETRRTPQPFVVFRTSGPAWDDAKDLTEQRDWPAHAAFMNALADERVILFGGTLDGNRDVVLVMDARDEAEIRTRLAADPWARSGQLVVKECRAWRIRLGVLR
jgi:uncharacterized protein YciI